MSNIDFKLVEKQGEKNIIVDYERLYVIGFAGRNVVKTMEHIKELEDIGIKGPDKIPTIYGCSNILLTKDEKIEVVGNDSSGEAEYIIVLKDGETYVGLGSDHTDRSLEVVSIAKSKQVCPKPIAGILWNYKEVKDHWDELKLISYQVVDGKEVLYQNGSVKDILPLEKILKEVSERCGELGNSILYSGTVPLLDGFKYGELFKCSLVDEKLDRKIELSYKIENVEK